LQLGWRLRRLAHNERKYRREKDDDERSTTQKLAALSVVLIARIHIVGVEIHIIEGYRHRRNDGGSEAHAAERAKA
jgi:hypothetical protein